MRGFARRWWPVVALGLLLFALQSKFWLGDGGWRSARELQDTVSAQRAENARLQQRNDALSAEVEDLKSGETAVEERARSELGMVKPGEVFYRVVEPHPESLDAAPAQGAELPATDAQKADAATSAAREPASASPAAGASADEAEGDGDASGDDGAASVHEPSGDAAAPGRGTPPDADAGTQGAEPGQPAPDQPTPSEAEPR